MQHTGHETNSTPLKLEDSTTPSPLPERLHHSSPNSPDQNPASLTPNFTGSSMLASLLNPGSSPRPSPQEMLNHALLPMASTGSPMQLPSLASIGLPSFASLARPSAPALIASITPVANQKPPQPTIPQREQPIFTGMDAPSPPPSLRRYDTWTKHFEELLHFRTRYAEFKNTIRFLLFLCLFFISSKHGTHWKSRW